MEPRVLVAYLNGSAMRRNIHELSGRIYMANSVDQSNGRVDLTNEYTVEKSKGGSSEGKRAKQKPPEKNKAKPRLKNRGASSTKTSAEEKPNNPSTPSSSYPELKTRKKTGRTIKTEASEKSRKPAKDKFVDEQSGLNSTSPVSEKKISGKKALTRQMSPEARAEARAQLIFEAIKSGPDRLQVLVELGIDLDVRNDKNETPLFIACSRRETECVRLLIEGGTTLPDDSQQQADLLFELMSRLYGQLNTNSPLPLLLNETDGPGIRALVNSCKNLDSFNLKGERHTPLTLACENRDASMVALLTEHGASRSFKDGRNMTPISSICAGYRRVRYMADALRALVADAPNAAELVNQVDNKGLTPLLQIVIAFDTVANVSLSRGGKLAPKGMHGYVTDAVEVLLKAGASMAATDSEKRGALYHAFFNLNASLVRLLYKHGASTGDLSEPQKSDIKRRVKSAMNENSGPWEDDWFKDHIKSL